MDPRKRASGTARTIAVFGGSGATGRALIAAALARRYRRQFPGIAADRDAQEVAVRESGLDWTLVKPFRISGARGTGHLRVAPAIRIGALTSVPRADLAELLVEEVTAGRFRGQAVYVAKGSARARFPTFNASETISEGAP